MLADSPHERIMPTPSYIGLQRSPQETVAMGGPPSITRSRFRRSGAVVVGSKRSPWQTLRPAIACRPDAIRDLPSASRGIVGIVSCAAQIRERTHEQAATVNQGRARCQGETRALRVHAGSPQIIEIPPVIFGDGSTEDSPKAQLAARGRCHWPVSGELLVNPVVDALWHREPY